MVCFRPSISTVESCIRSFISLFDCFIVSKIPLIFGKGGSTINDLEKRLKVHIDVVEKGPSDETATNYELPFTF